MDTFADYKRKAESFGSSLEDRDDWFVLLYRSRDSAIIDESNFAAALKSLGGESDTCEVVRFGHWACGWIEHIFLHPSRQAEGEAIEGALSDYPILDESNFSEREQETVLPAWESWGQREWARMLCEACDLDRTSETYNFLCLADGDATLTWHEARGEQSGLEFDDNGPRFSFRYADKRYAH